MDTLSGPEQQLVAGAQRFAEQDIAPFCADWERQKKFEISLIPAAAEIGLTAIEVPRSAGGLGFSFSCKARVAEELAKADFGVAMSIINTHNVARKLALLLEPSRIPAFVPDLIAGKRIGCTALTEPGAGSDFAAIQTIATPSENGYLLSGEKAWIINAVTADTIVLYAKIATDDGESRSAAASIAAFLVDVRRPGIDRTAAFDLNAQHTIGAGGFQLQNYFAAAGDILVPAGEAFKAALKEINGARTYVGAMCCGMVQAAIDIASDYGRQRHTFGRSLHGHQGWRWQLAQAKVDLAAARALVVQAAQCIDRGDDAQALSAQAKIFATQMAERQLPAMLQAMGAEGLRDRYPLGRHMMGARTASFTDGSTEMLLERIGKTL